MASHLLWQISACTVLHFSSLHPISTHSQRGDKWKYSVLGVKRDFGAMSSLSFGKNYIEWKDVGRKQFWSWRCLLDGEWSRWVSEGNLQVLPLGPEPAWKRSRFVVVPTSPFSSPPPGRGRRLQISSCSKQRSLLYCHLFKCYLSECLQIMKPRKKKNQPEAEPSTSDPNMQTKQGLQDSSISLQPGFL